MVEGKCTKESIRLENPDLVPPDADYPLLLQLLQRAGEGLRNRPQPGCQDILVTEISYTTPSRNGSHRFLISSNTKNTRLASTSRRLRFSTRSVILLSHLDKDPSMRIAIFGSFSRRAMDGLFGKKRSSQSLSAAAKDCPTSRMWRTCSFPSSEILQILTLPETTMKKPSAGSPSRKTTSRLA